MGPSGTDADDEDEEIEVQSLISLEDDFELNQRSAEQWEELGMGGKTAKEMRDGVRKHFGRRAEGYSKRLQAPRQTLESRKKVAYKAYKWVIICLFSLMAVG